MSPCEHSCEHFFPGDAPLFLRCLYYLMFHLLPASLSKTAVKLSKHPETGPPDRHLGRFSISTRRFCHPGLLWIFNALE